MRCSHAAGILIVALGCVCIPFVAVEGKPKSIGPDEACKDFADGNNPRPAWTLADCTKVWTQFVDTVPPELHGRQRFADIWRHTATELRRAGLPCLSRPHGGGDGVGSMTMRLLDSWIFSEEMGCEWVTPDWGKRHVTNGNGTVLYCHKTSIFGETKPSVPSVATLEERSHCSVVNWLAYFQFSVPSVSLPEGAILKEIEVDTESLKEFQNATLSLNQGSFTDQGWDRIMITYHVTFASQHFIAVGNWDEHRRQTVRRIIGRARHNFHVHPRPWYDEDPECDYDPDRLNFALHVRMGDRRAMLGESEQYFLLLERFMDTVSEEVVRKGLEPPLFHVFSEALIPCPSEDTGLFDEFPSWPVHQVPECLTAEVPDHCAENQAGRPCSPNRPGKFDVIGKPLVLHVGPVVYNTMSCMIQADGLLMGCSTLGQLSGILSKGISFFSTHCSGVLTLEQYLTVPPIAVAERGYLWVPVAGSWHDPVLDSTQLLRGALDTLLENRGVPSR